ncbi:uncharacterized protein LOC130754268 isoform X1 [Actinidia eriantha]|uniref:uncharacterized protein LOC130754268 isoform X1 n=2 Tax=Actinidia eriantha TaxID=165200 RepID=UPI00258C0A00|nr:uncharacterized protein LOC130754268 isoform X1 [Actinidia eriantha]
MGEPCDICGDIGVLEAIFECSCCKIAHEHIYCRKRLCDVVPDAWLCEACEMGSKLSPKSGKQDLPKTSLSKPTDVVDQETANSAGNSKLLKWEKIGRPGKVKYIPAQEAVMLSSGAKKCGSPSQINIRPSYGPSKIVGSMSAMTPIKPKATFPKSPVHVKVNPSFGPPGFSPPKHGNMQTSPVVQKQVTPTLKDSKAVSEKKATQASREEHVHIGWPMDALVPAVETKNASTKAEKVVNKTPCESALVMHAQPITSSGTVSCGNDCTNVKSRNIDVNNGDLMNILPETEKCFRGPALDSSWNGNFEVLDTIYQKELNDEFHAHPPSKVHRKVYAFSKEMPKVLQFKTLPRKNVWTDIFQDDCPDADDIGLYFFSSNSQSYREFIETQDLVLRSYIDGVELFVFTSKLLSANSQRWNEEYFLWGIFRCVKRKISLYKLYEKPLPIIQSSDSARSSDANEDDNVADMEIDMIGGKDVGKVDMAIPKESSRKSCGSSREERATATSLQGLETKIMTTSRKLDFATQWPLLVKRELCNDVPPGFEEICRLKARNNACTEMVGVEKSLLNRKEKALPEERVSKVSGAGCVQRKAMEDSDSPRVQEKHHQVQAHTPTKDPMGTNTSPVLIKRNTVGPGDEKCVKMVKEEFMSTPSSKDGSSHSCVPNWECPQNIFNLPW